MWCPRSPNQKSAGFSIIEMAIAIIVIGITLTLTLRGTALVDLFQGYVTGARLQQLQNNVFVYSNTFNALPGDDPSPTWRFKREPALFIFDGRPVSLVDNGIIDGKLGDFNNVSGEHFMAWRDLRYAKLIDGDPAIIGFASLPENPFGGIYGFDQGNLGQKRGSICATKVPGRAAQGIDERIDDGAINTGKVVATSKFSMEQDNHFDAPDSVAYDLEKEYIICVPITP